MAGVPLIGVLICMKSCKVWCESAHFTCITKRSKPLCVCVCVCVRHHVHCECEELKMGLRGLSTNMFNNAQVLTVHNIFLCSPLLHDLFSGSGPCILSQYPFDRLSDFMQYPCWILGSYNLHWVTCWMSPLGDQISHADRLCKCEIQTRL